MTNQNLKTCSSSGFCPKNGIIIPTIMIIREVLEQLLEIIREVLQQLLEIIRVVLQQVLQILRKALL